MINVNHGKNIDALLLFTMLPQNPISGLTYYLLLGMVPTGSTQAELLGRMDFLFNPTEFYNLVIVNFGNLAMAVIGRAATMMAISGIDGVVEVEIHRSNYWKQHIRKYISRDDVADGTATVFVPFFSFHHGSIS